MTVGVPRTRVVTLNAALGPLDYRVPDGMQVEPGSVVIAPLGPRQLIGVAWEADRFKVEEIGDNRLRPLAGLVDVPPIRPQLRRLAEWTADYYLSPLAARAADDPALVVGAIGPEDDDRISPDRRNARAPDSAADPGTRCDRRPPGHDP